jgi:hypothetical protein
MIDEIGSSYMEKIKVFLKKNALSSKMDQVFWVQIPEDMLSETQYEHKNCRPHVFAVELGRDFLKLEFFVRSLKSMQCTCPSYATPQQRDFIIHFADGMIDQLGVKT